MQFTTGSCEAQPGRLYDVALPGERRRRIARTVAGIAGVLVTVAAFAVLAPYARASVVPLPSGPPVTRASAAWQLASLEGTIQRGEMFKINGVVYRAVRVSR